MDTRIWHTPRVFPFHGTRKVCGHVKRSLGAAAAAVALGFGALGCAQSTSQLRDVAPFGEQISWSACDGDEAPPAPFECGHVTVPLDYRSEDAKTLSIAVVRYPATATSREGVLLTNPGGPGASGIDFVTSAARDISSHFGLEAYDIIGFDPRGVGLSGAVECYSAKDNDELNLLDGTPDTPTEKKLFEKWDTETDPCVEKYGSQLSKYSTEFAARDMDLIRVALGVPRISFLGISYGTHLGAVYASIFPDNFDAMVLDGAVDREGDTIEETYLTQAVGFEKSFNSWVEWCQDNDECAFRAEDVKKRWNDLYDKLDKQSIFLDNKREVNHRTMMDATIISLYSRDYWDDLGKDLSDLAEGDGARVLESADWQNGRQDDGTYDNESTARYLINCSSGMGYVSPKDPKKILARLTEVAPWYSQGWTIDDFADVGCADEYGDGSIFPVKYSGVAPILVIGGLKDPATPVQWSEQLVSRLGDHSSLVKVNAEGHSQVLNSKCVDEIVLRVFVNKKLPNSGYTCQPDVPVAKPAFWDAAVAGIVSKGVLLDPSVWSRYKALKPTDAFATYVGLSMTPAAAQALIIKQLEASGFPWVPGENGKDFTHPQFFGGRSLDYVGVEITPKDELSRDDMYSYDPSLPTGGLVVTLYYWP
jgi:pimeloyl-ACP methyl ester carboxylesterase